MVASSRPAVEFMCVACSRRAYHAQESRASLTEIDTRIPPDLCRCGTIRPRPRIAGRPSLRTWAVQLRLRPPRPLVAPRRHRSVEDVVAAILEAQLARRCVGQESSHPKQAGFVSRLRRGDRGWPIRAADAPDVGP